MSLAQFTSPRWQFFDTNGDPLSGGTIETYEPGTSTAKTAYQDRDGTTAHTAAIELDSRGSAVIYLDGEYKIVLKDADGVTVATDDYVSGSVTDTEISGLVTVNFTSDADLTLTTAQSRYRVISLTDTGTVLTTGRNVIFPADTRVYTIDNNTAQTLTGKTSAGTGIALAVSSRRTLYCDGTNVLRQSTILADANTWTGAQTFNKIADISTFTDSADTTKKVRLDAGNVATSTTRVLTMPDADVTISSYGATLVDDADASTARTTLEVLSETEVNTLIEYIDPAHWPTIANGTDADHDIDISTGIIGDSTGDYGLELTSSLTKQIDATWAAGDAAGGLFSGTVAADTTYHIFLIRADADGSIDAGFDTSVSAANIPTGYTAYRRVGSVVTDASANILAFTQLGDHFILGDHVEDADTTVGTTAALITLSVPSGISVDVDLLIGISVTNTEAIAVSSPYTNDFSVSDNYNAAPSDVKVDVTRQRMMIRTNTSGQVRVRGGDASQAYSLNTFGWRDSRGID